MIWPWRRKRDDIPPELRNAAISDISLSQMPRPVYTTWTISKAVKEGYRANGWVYRCAYMISKAAASVPWIVVDADGTKIDRHPLADMLSRPNPHISRQDLVEIIVLWLQLAGNAYMKRVTSGRRTLELWPISPDRCRPIPAPGIDEWILGYAMDLSQSVTFQPEEIIHLKLIDPSNPLVGISPLEVAGKSVDCDNAMADHNTATSQNRGVIDGVFTFERQFQTLDDADAIAKKIEEKYGKRRGFAVLGGNAKYQRLGMDMAEMDFVNSRRFSREEICTIFGVPLPLIDQSASTYSNFENAELVLWTLTVIPLLEDISDSFTFSLRDELRPGEKVRADISNVPAIRAALVSRTEAAQNMHQMGVPFDRINALFGFGVDEYPGWDASHIQGASSGLDGQQRRSGHKFELRAGRIEIRALEDEIEAAANGEPLRDFEVLLKKQQTSVFRAIEMSGDIEGAVSENRGEWEKAMKRHYIAEALRFGRNVIVESRESLDVLADAMADYFDRETFLLAELSMTEATTVSVVLEKIRQGLAEGKNTADIQMAIIDSGIFSPERALRLARTLTGTAASIGQHYAAKESGATHKRWIAGGGARPQHSARSGETVPIDGHFSAAFGESVGPRYPLDPYLPPADRVNCRCSMAFERRV